MKVRVVVFHRAPCFAPEPRDEKKGDWTLLKITRTRAGRNFREKLAEINDQVWLMDMISFVFDDFLERSEHSSDQAMTTRSLLPSYQDARRLDYSLANLKEFHQHRRHLHLALFLISAFEYASDYIDDVHAFIAKNCGLDVPQKNKLSVEEWVQACLEALNRSGLENMNFLLKSLKYFRLMRNALSHGEGEFSRDFALYVKSEGESLNSFWRDFESDEIIHSFADANLKAILIARRVSALIHFLRIVVGDLEKVYSSLVGFDHVVPIAYQEVLAANPTKRADEIVLSRKVTALLERDFGVECSEADLKSRVMAWIMHNR